MRRQIIQASELTMQKTRNNNRSVLSPFACFEMGSRHPFSQHAIHSQTMLSDVPRWQANKTLLMPRVYSSDTKRPTNTLMTVAMRTTKTTKLVSPKVILFGAVESVVNFSRSRRLLVELGTIPGKLASS